MISIGIISTAGINRQSLLIPVAKRSDCRIAAVASRTFQTAKKYAEFHKIPMAYGSYQELLDESLIDVVYISTPNAFHDFWVEKALQAGKHVICEKPAFTQKGKAESLKKLALSQNLLLMEAMHYRYHPALMDFFKTLEQKILGDIALVKAALSYYRPNDLSNIRLNADLKGGSFMHLGCYCLDAITSIINRPLMFQDLKAVKNEKGIDLQCIASLVTTDRKTQAELFCDFSGDVFESEIEVKGANGFMRLRSGLNPTKLGSENSRDIWILETDLFPKPYLLSGEGLSTYDYQLDYFIENLKRGNLVPRVNIQASELLAEGIQLLTKTIPLLNEESGFSV